MWLVPTIPHPRECSRKTVSIYFPVLCMYFLQESPWSQGSCREGIAEISSPAPETKMRSISQSVIISRVGSTTIPTPTFQRAVCHPLSSGSPASPQTIASAALPLPVLPPFNPISFSTAALPPQAFSCAASLELLRLRINAVKPA